MHFLFMLTKTLKIITKYPKSNQYKAFPLLQGPSDPTKDCRNQPLDMLILIDGSSSVGSVHFKQMLRFVDGVISRLHPSSRVSMVQFASFPVTQFTFKDAPTLEIARKNVENVRYLHGITRMGDALKHCVGVLDQRNGNRPSIPDTLVMLTDGRSYDDPVPAAKLLRHLGVRIVVVGIGSTVDPEQIVKIVQHEDDMLLVTSYKKLMHPLTDVLVQTSC